MIPILYAPTETEFKSNGIGRLVDCTECTVIEERNGRYECSFKYPITGAHYSDIQEGCIIACIHDDEKDIQAFDIYARSAPIDGIVTFNARHISYRLSNVIVQPFTAGTCAEALLKMQTQTINTNPFTMWTDKSVVGTYNCTVPASVKELLGGVQGSILDIYGTGEYEWDNWTVRLYLHRGQETDVEIRYGKNLINLTQTYDVSGIYNTVVPYWQDVESGDVVTLTNWTVQAPNTGSTQIIVPMDLSSEIETKPTEAQLQAQAHQRLDNSDAWYPDENIEVDFVALWQTEEYKDVAPLQRLCLCDRAKIYYPELGITAKQMQVILVEYDVLMERYSRMELGNSKTSFAETIMADTQLYVKQNTVSRDVLDRAISRATDLITGGGGGYVVTVTDADGRPTETLYMDTDDVSTAVHVIRINKNGIGFSTSGINGPYTTAWTIGGNFVADFITTGNLSANLITTGTLSADRIGAGVIQSQITGNYWNLTTGIFRSGSSLGRCVELNDGRILIYNTTVQSTPLGVISANSNYTSLSSNTGGVALGRTSGNTYQNVLLIRNGETSTGYSEDAICYYTWRFNAAPKFMLGLNTQNAITFSNSATLNAVTITSSGTTYQGIQTSGVLNVGSILFAMQAGINAPGRSIASGYIFHVGGSAYISATVSAQTVTQRSDENQKNIREWDDRYTGLIDDLEPIVYTWKDGEDKKEHVGLGARHTKELLKEHGLEDSGFVHINADDEHSIIYSELTVMLLKKVQEQQMIINNLSKRVEALEGMICTSN